MANEELILFIQEQISDNLNEIADVNLDKTRIDNDILAQQYNITYLESEKVTLDEKIANLNNDIIEYNNIITVLES